MPDSNVVSASEGNFAAHDGLKLFYRRWEAGSPKGICLLAHGIAEHSGRYQHVAGALAQRGFSVWAPDHRGHGRSGGLRGDCRSISDFVEDLRLLGAKAGETLPGLPLAVVGHSLGGLIALNYAARYPAELKAVAASSPAIKLTHETSPLTVAVVTAVSRVFPAAPFHNGVNPNVLCRDPAVVEAYKKDPLVHDILRARCAVALRHAMLESMSLAEKIKIPCLILQAGADEICDPVAAERFAGRLNGNGVFRRYEGAYHELLNEPDRERAVRDLCDWLEEKIRSC